MLIIIIRSVRVLQRELHEWSLTAGERTSDTTRSCTLELMTTAGGRNNGGGGVVVVIRHILFYEKKKIVRGREGVVETTKKGGLGE